MPPLTGRLWWQIAADRVPADTNTTGKQTTKFDNKIKSYMTYHFEAQKWTTDILDNIAAVRTSCMESSEIEEVRQKRQVGYMAKFPRSSSMFATKVFTRKNGREVDFRNFNQERHGQYGSRAIKTDVFQ